MVKASLDLAETHLVMFWGKLIVHHMHTTSNQDTHNARTGTQVEYQVKMKLNKFSLL